MSTKVIFAKIIGVSMYAEALFKRNAVEWWDKPTN